MMTSSKDISAGGAMREPAPMRPLATRMLAAGRVPALLVALGLGASGVPLVAAAAESAAQDRPKEAPIPRWAHAAAVLDGKIYVIGGVGADNEPISSVEVYDPATDTWGVCAGIPTPRALFGASTVGGKIYAVGGTTMGLDSLPVVEAYDPATDTWSRRADMPTPPQLPVCDRGRGEDLRDRRLGARSAR